MNLFWDLVALFLSPRLPVDVWDDIGFLTSQESASRNLRPFLRQVRKRAFFFVRTGYATLETTSYVLPLGCASFRSMPYGILKAYRCLYFCLT